MFISGFMAILLAIALEEVKLERVGRFGHAAIREASGLVASRKHPGIFWTHNDSGNPPALFAVRRDGTLVREYRVGALNVDWEDIATDDAGHLFIGEIGNNDVRLPLRAIYQVEEPDPLAEGSTDLKVTTACYYRFGEWGRFDAEGLVVEKGQALVVGKSFDGREAEVYAIPLDPPASLLRPAVAKRVGTLPGFVGPATGASLSAKGGLLAVCGLKEAAVYRRGKDGDWGLVWRGGFESGDQIEAVAWEGEDLILAGEGRGIFRIKEATWKHDVLKHEK